MMLQGQTDTADRKKTSVVKTRRMNEIKVA